MSPKKNKPCKSDSSEPLAEAMKGLLKLQDATHISLANQIKHSKNSEWMTGKDVIKQKKLEEEAERELDMRFLRQELGLDNKVRFDDGDQTPLKGDKAQVLRNQWVGSMDYSHENPHLSDWLMSLYRGDYDAVMGFINSLEKEKVPMLLEVRESMLNVSAVFHVIIGARSLFGRDPFFRDFRLEVEKTMEIKNDHQKILAKLIELKVNIHAKDVAGYTPLHHCLTGYSNPTTISMAKQLLKAGADPNMKNRFGCTPLMESIMAANFDALKLLIEFGADPDIKDNNGTSCRYMATNIPRVSEMFCKADRKKAKQSRADARNKAGGSLRLCKVCGVDNETKRCTGCYMVMYCGQECQMGDWPNHMGNCKVTRAQYKPVKLVEYDVAGKDNITKEIYVHKIGDLPSQKHFVVKVQVPLEHSSTDPSPLLVYNRDRSLCGNLKRDDHAEVYDKLVSRILEEGFNRQMGFYYAIYSGPGSGGKVKKNKSKQGSVEIKINPEILLPVEKW